MKQQLTSFQRCIPVFLFLFTCLMPMKSLQAQDYVTGAFEGVVRNSVTGDHVPGATVQIINRETGVPIVRQTDSQGRFRQPLLAPGDYNIRVLKEGFLAYEGQQSLPPMKATTVIPVPVNLMPVTSAPVATATPSEAVDATAKDTSKPPSVSSSTSQTVSPTSELLSELNTTDAQRSGTFGEKEVSTLPLGGASLTRSFDELGLLLPGVALPPLSEGGGTGPGVGAGVGSSGQFAVNGLRSRANNFTVDGSDNNDEDIGVRRQGFFALVPQPIESIQVYQVTTLLAPAQYGRNFGAQVNAVSKSGGNDVHGVLFGFLNTSQLNSRNFFDTTNGSGTTALRSTTGQAVLDCTGTFSPIACIGRNRPITTTNQSGGEDSFTLGQGGFVLGGPIKKDKAFFFVSYEKQVLNATKEASFAVPTVDRRGIFNTGATGLFADCTTALDPGFDITNCTPANSAHFFPEFGFPTAAAGDAVFSLFPFPNNPNGVYGANTFTETLPASARGDIASGKYNQNFKLWDKPQTFTARYNFTQDRRDIPVTGGALFSSLRPRVRTQNISTFLTSQISNSVSNVLSLSYGRTRLVFDELRNPFLKPSQISPNEPFLLNAPRLVNVTINPMPINFVGIPNTGPVLYVTNGTAECGSAPAPCNNAFDLGLGRIGQVNIAGFSPIGVDVNNFPQKRVNNTYQVSDVFGYQIRQHTLAFGLDIRRVELNSLLPRNSRTLLSYQGAPEFNLDPTSPDLFTGNFYPGIDFAAAGAPSGAFLSLARTDSAIGLRYHDFSFFGQDTWRIRQDLSLNFGLRYEYNTPPREAHNLIERTFDDPLLNNPNAVGLKKFIAGRTGIFDATRTNFAPRFGLAWSPQWFGQDHTTVIRAGFGLFYDQILGAVVSQSRNVFPNFITVNTGGGGESNPDPIYQLPILSYFNPARGGICFATNFAGSCNNFQPLVQPGTLNTLNPALTPNQVINIFNSGGLLTGVAFPNGIQVTLPDRNIKPPSAEHYSVTLEQQLNANLVLSVGYVGTRGHNLLRASTPNLGPNNVVFPIFIVAGVDDPNCFPVITNSCFSLSPVFTGLSFAPGNAATGFGRPTAGAGPVFLYESGGDSRYDALQLQLRGRFSQGLQFQAGYTFSRTRDNASDVFDLAGAPALPQNSLTRQGEFGLSNFDATNRFAYNLIYDFPTWGDPGDTFNAITKGLQFVSSGYYQTGQPFSVNSIFDVNLDGNLTDRLNTTQGVSLTGNRRQPILLSSGLNTASLLATPGEDGSIGRNSFRAGSILNLDLAVVKNISLSETKRLVFRADVFNFLNRANFGIPVRFLEAPGFGTATETVTPGRRIQFGIKFAF